MFGLYACSMSAFRCMLLLLLLVSILVLALLATVSAAAAAGGSMSLLKRPNEEVLTAICASQGLLDCCCCWWQVPKHVPLAVAGATAVEPEEKPRHGLLLLLLHMPGIWWLENFNQVSGL